MKLRPISLGVSRPAGAQQGQVSDLSSNNSIPNAEVFARDGDACQYCGFVATKYQDVYFLNGMPTDRRLANMVTACVFCHDCLTLEKAGKKKSGLLIWLPEIGQAALHHICRAIYISRLSSGAIGEAAKKALIYLKEREEGAKERLGTGDPAVLGTVLYDFLEPNHYEARQEKLAGIRFLPLDHRIVVQRGVNFNQFTQLLSHWRSSKGPFKGLKPASWLEMLTEVQDESGNQTTEKNPSS